MIVIGEMVGLVVVMVDVIVVDYSSVFYQQWDFPIFGYCYPCLQLLRPGDDDKEGLLRDDLSCRGLLE